MRVVLCHMVFASLVGMVMRDMMLHCDQGSVRRIGNSRNAKGEAQNQYSEKSLHILPFPCY